MMFYVGIETSFDDFSFSIIDNSHKVIYLETQTISEGMWKDFGGVIPKIIIKKGSKKIIDLRNNLLSFITTNNIVISKIFVTCTPGIPGCLAIGKESAKELSKILIVPVIGINHLHGHFYSNFLDNNINIPKIALYAVFSGGNTKVYLVKEGNFTVLSETRDISLGSMLDKLARDLKFLNAIEMDQYKQQINFNISLPNIRFKKGNMLDFSFAGLETSFKKFIALDNNNLTNEEKAYIIMKAAFTYCAKQLQKIINSLDYKIEYLVLGGGVISNRFFHQIIKMFLLNKIEIIIGDLKYQVDNGAMIAIAGIYSKENYEF